ncbi:hypothetical protein GQ457_06G012740 [Hibiscus cannabinus]
MSTSDMGVSLMTLVEYGTSIVSGHVRCFWYDENINSMVTLLYLKEKKDVREDVVKDEQGCGQLLRTSIRQNININCFEMYDVMILGLKTFREIENTTRRICDCMRKSSRNKHALMGKSFELRSIVDRTAVDDTSTTIKFSSPRRGGEAKEIRVLSVELVRVLESRNGGHHRVHQLEDSRPVKFGRRKPPDGAILSPTRR